MRAFVNRQLINATGVDSGALTMLGAVIHPFAEPGEYLGTAVRGEEAESFRLSVDEESKAMQVDVDLAGLGRARPKECECTPEGWPRFVVNPEGYVVFYVSRGVGGYAVQVGRLTEREEAVFDSRELQPGDLFAVTLIRPGRYSVRNVLSRASGEIAVAYPKVGRERVRARDPVQVECTQRTIRPARIAIEAAQGQVYRFRTPSRVVIELERPQDEPPRRGGERKG